MSWQERIVVDPAILVGKPVVRGTRLSVELIVDLLAQGWSEADILRSYPTLTAEDIHACLNETLPAGLTTPGLPPTIRIVAVTAVHNRRDLTVDCLRSLFASNLSGLALRVVVVDDGSTDGTAAAVQAAWPDVTIVRGDGALFYTAGTNRGLAVALQSDADYVLSFNNDSRFPPDCLQRLVGCARLRPRAVVGPLLVSWDEPDRVFQIDPVWDTWYGGWRHWTRQTVRSVPALPWAVSQVVGNCVLMPMAALREVGLMRDDVLPNIGDGEHVVRMRRAGWLPVIEPRARLRCQPNTPPRRLRSLSFAELFTALWTNRFSKHSLRERWCVNWLSAPSRRQGAAAFVVHLARLLLKAAGLQPAWPNEWDEAPLLSRVRVLADEGAGVRPLVWYVWPYVEWGGAQIYFLHLATAARARGYDVRMLMPRASAPALVTLMTDAGVPVVFVDGQHDLAAGGVVRRIVRRWRNASANRAICRALARVDARSAVVHADLAPWASCRTLERLLRRGPVTVTLHTALPPVAAWRRWLWRRRIGRLDRHPRYTCLITNEDVRRSLVPYLPPERLAALALSPSTVDAAEIDRAWRVSLAARGELEARLDLRPTARRIAVAAQFVDRKGVGVLLDALTHLRDSRSPVQCLWFGTTALSDADERRIAARQLGDLFQYMAPGRVGPAVRDYLHVLRPLTDVYVLPSLVEGLPLALLEAMALGLPVIATRVNAVPDVVRHGETGWLVPPQDATALADAIDRLLCDASLRGRLGEAARVEALRRYERDVATLPTIAAYGRLTAAGAARS